MQWFVSGWSPDGSMLVSAHAMNGGGPTAQIIERSTWSTTRDFVGHKKAISCVRFNRYVIYIFSDTLCIFFDLRFFSKLVLDILLDNISFDRLIRVVYVRGTAH